jgi:hypothetical protein
VTAFTNLKEVQDAQPGYLSMEAASSICPITVTIKSCEERTFGQGAQAEKSVVLTFVESNKYLTLTKTRLRHLQAVVKSEDPLAGQKIKLVVGDFDTGRGEKKMVGIVAPD